MIAPSMVVFPLAQIPRDLAESVPSTWGIGRSKSGWMCADTFFEYVANVFNPWIIESGIEKPVILFLDGHSSHLSLELSTFCEKEQIMLISLYPNTTHVSQPLDVSVFFPLKEVWKSVVREWRLKHPNNKLKRTDFSKLLEGALGKLSNKTLENGFKHCGLFPFSPEVIPNLFDRQKRRKNAAEETVELAAYQKKTTLSYVEKFIGKQKMATFQNDSFNLEDSGLYYFWKNLSTQTANSNELGTYLLSGFYTFD